MDPINRGIRNINPNHQIFCNFLTAELLLAFEKVGILERIAAKDSFAVKEIAEGAGLAEDLLLAACEFLAEQGLCKKFGKGVFGFPDGNYNYSVIKPAINFFLAYEKMYESFADLLSSSKIYGRDIVRVETYYRRSLNTIIAPAFPVIISRFKELGIKNILGIGANSMGLLSTVLEEIRPSVCMTIVTSEEAPMMTEEEKNRPKHDGTIKVFAAAIDRPEIFPEETAVADALIGVAVFHDFYPEEGLISVLAKYRKIFTSQRLFIVEFDFPDWDNLRDKAGSPVRHVASISRLIHSFKREVGPQPKSMWMRVIETSGWRMAHIKTLESGLVIYECV